MLAVCRRKSPDSGLTFSCRMLPSRKGVSGLMAIHQTRNADVVQEVASRRQRISLAKKTGQHEIVYQHRADQYQYQVSHCGIPGTGGYCSDSGASRHWDVGFFSAAAITRSTFNAQTPLRELAYKGTPCTRRRFLCGNLWAPNLLAKVGILSLVWIARRSCRRRTALRALSAV